MHALLNDGVDKVIYRMHGSIYLMTCDSCVTIDSSFHEPYFSRKLIFHKSHRENKTLDYDLKTYK